MQSSRAPHLLDIRSLDSDNVETLPTEQLEALTEIRVGYIPNGIKLMNFLSRCPNVDTLWCGETFQNPHKDGVSAHCLPSLKRFTGPLEIAMLLVPGRPLEEVLAFGSPGREPSSDTTGVAKLMAAGTGRLRYLQLGIADWREGCLGDIAALCPHLEGLVLFVRELPKQWLPTNIIGVFDRFTLLRTIGVFGREPPGPPIEEELELQRRALDSARMAHPRLTDVRFKRDVYWTADYGGLWAATYHENLNQKRIVWSPLNYLSPEPRRSDHVAHMTESPLGRPLGPQLPPEILMQVISEVESTREPWEDAIKAPPSPSPAQTTLKNLSLVDETFRPLAQATLFNYIHLYGNIAQCHFRSRNLLRMLSAREESRGWIKILRLNWRWNFDGVLDDIQTIQPPAEGQRALMDLVSDLFVRLTQLRVFQADCVKITQPMYLHIFRLQTLRSITCNQRWTAGGEGSDASVADLAIEDLHIQTHSQSRRGLVERATARLARSPYLRKLQARAVVFTEQPSPYTFHTLTDLNVDFFQTGHGLTDVLMACSNLTSLEIWGYELAQGGTSATIPMHAVPFLKRLNSPLALARELVGGRPVESIYIQALRGRVTQDRTQWSKQVLIPLTLGTVSVKELSFSGYQWREDGMNIIFGLFPLLEYLGLHFRGAFQPRWIQEHLLDEVRRFKNLRFIQHRVDDTFVGTWGVTEVTTEMEQEERLVLNEALSLRPTLKEVASRFNNNWKLNGNQVWEMAWLQRHKGTEDGGVWAAYM